MRDGFLSIHKQQNSLKQRTTTCTHKCVIRGRGPKQLAVALEITTAPAPHHQSNPLRELFILLHTVLISQELNAG